MSFWNKIKQIFKTKEAEKDFYTIANEQIQNCKKNIRIYEQDIYKFGKGAAELIHKLFFVPENWWYKEIDFFEKIIDLPQNLNVPMSVKMETEEIIKTYRYQIKLRKQKIEFCKNNIKEISDLIEKQKKLDKKIKEEQIKVDTLKKHKQITENLTDQNTAYKTTVYVENLKQEIKQLEEQLALKKEINKQLAELYYKYSTAKDFASLEEYEKKVENLTQKNN